MKVHAIRSAQENEHGLTNGLRLGGRGLGMVVEDAFYFGCPLAEKRQSWVGWCKF